MAKFYREECGLVDGHDFIGRCFGYGDGLSQMRIDELLQVQREYLHLNICRPCADEAGHVLEKLAVGSDQARDVIVNALSIFDDVDRIDPPQDYQI